MKSQRVEGTGRCVGGPKEGWGHQACWFGGPGAGWGSWVGTLGSLPRLPISQVWLPLLSITGACPEDEIDSPQEHRVGAESLRGGAILIRETGWGPRRAWGAYGGARAEVGGPQLGAVCTACPGCPHLQSQRPPPQYWPEPLSLDRRPSCHTRAPGPAGAFHQMVREGTAARNVPFARAHWQPGGQQPCGVGDVSPEVQARLVSPRGLASQGEDDLTPRAARLASPEQSLPGAAGGTSTGRGMQGAQGRSRPCGDLCFILCHCAQEQRTHWSVCEGTPATATS